MISKPADLQKYDFNQRLFLEGLEADGNTIIPIEGTHVAIAQKKKNKDGIATLTNEIIFDIHSYVNSFTSSWMCSDKYLTKKWLQSHDFPVTKGRVFSKQTRKNAIFYARSLGFPVVLKPASASHGDFVYANITSLKELEDKIEILIRDFIGEFGYFLVEQHFFGEEFRLFVTRNNFFAAVHRTPASVVGDGKHTILQLIEISNHQRMNPRVNCLCQIRLDDVLFNFLKKKNISPDSIPSKDTVVFVRDTSNVSKGGGCKDVTDEVHSSIKKFAFTVLNAIPDMHYVGIDFLCEDHTKDIFSMPHVICELNDTPGLSLHTLPGEGKKRDVVSALVSLTKS